MLKTAADQPLNNSVAAQARRNDRAWWLMYLALLGITGGLYLLMYRSAPDPSFIAFTLFFLGAAIILLNPRYGLYLVLFLTLVGDGKLVDWYPFFKNLSSRESLLFVSDAVILSPLEIYIVLIFFSWLARRAFARDRSFITGPVFWSSMLFTGFVVFGLSYGLATGGDVNVALWEARALFYLPALLVLVSNLCSRREHYSHLMWAALLAIFVEGVIGVYFFFVTLGGSLDGVERLTEHSASIHMNTFILFTLAVWVFRRGSWSKRLILPLLLPPVLITYFVSQRRAAFIVLAIALVFIGAALFRERRRLFYVIAPLTVVAAFGYLLAFWNVQGPAGLPAQAIKSIVAPESASAKDQSSNLYREIENFNISFTIHQKPLTGVGFGQKFFIIWPLPDISFFVWWEYITHNSILWIWMKTGVGGFISMLFLMTTAIASGIRASWRLPGGDAAAIGLTATMLVAMHFIFAYVDMAWDIQSMVYLGMMLGVINSLEVVFNRPVPQPELRFPWQAPPAPAPQLVPLPFDAD
jgi:hypothetical protein